MMIRRSTKRRNLIRNIAALFVGGAILSPGIAPEANATTYTWTSLTTPGDWTVAGNWLGSNPFVTGSANELMFYADSTTNIAAATRTITNVPTTLSMNTLTLNGKGASSGASSSNLTIGSSASTWTIGDGTISVVNLNGTQGATGAADFNITVATNLSLNQANTLFTGNGTAGNGNNTAFGPGFTFSGSIGEAAAGYSFTKSGSSRMTLSSNNLTFTGGITVNGGVLFLTGSSTLNLTNGITIDGATLQIGNNTATQLTSGANPAGTYAGNFTLANGGNLQFRSSANQILTGAISGNGGLTKMGTGTLTLSDSNTYTGKTVIAPTSGPTSAGTLVVSSFNSVNGGTPLLTSSSLGAPTTVANGTIDLGAGIASTATLQYSGVTATGETTDRVINLIFNAGSARTLDASNPSGLLRFTSAFTSNGSTQTGAFVLTGTGNGQIDQGLPQLSTAGLSKQGAGTWTLGGSGNFTGPTIITAGTLSLSSATALQFSPFNTASVAGGASAGLKIATTTLSLGGLTGTNALDTLFTTALGGPSNTTTKGGYDGLTALTLTNATGTTSTYSGAIINGASGMTLTKTGNGTQFLNGANSYTGLTTVSAGTLGSSGSFSGPVTVAAGAGLAPGASANAFGTLTISNASASALTLNGSNLLVDISTASNDLIDVTGNVVLNGTNTVILNPTTGVANGTYTLATYAAKTGTGSMVFANGLTTLGTASLAANTGNIQMTVSGGALNNSVWVGTTATWDSGTNWNRNGAASSSFVDGDWVTIDDTGSNAATITSTGTVSPAQLTFNNSSKAFVVTATIGGAGTPLVKMGTNTATLGSSAALITNSYSGGTVILGGTLTLAGPSSTNLNPLLGDASGGITLNGGELRVTSNNLSGARQVSVLGGGGSLFVNKNNNFTTSGILTGSGTLNLLDGGGSGTPSTYNFNSTSNDFTGGIVLNNAILSVGRLDDSANNIVFNSNLGVTAIAGTSALRLASTAGAPLSLSTRAIVFNSAVATGIAITNNNTTQAITIGSNLVATGAGAKTITLDAVAGPTNLFSGNITNGTGGGTVAVTKSGAGLWTLSGANTYSGNTNVTAGTLTMDSSSSFNPSTNAAGKLLINGSNAVVNIAGTYNSPNGNGDAYIEISGGGVLNFSGTSSLGSAAVSGGGFRIGQGSAGTMNVTAGSMTYTALTGSNFILGRTAGNGTLSVTGGTLTATGLGNFVVANDGTATGTVNVGTAGNLVVSTANFILGASGTATAATFNLNTGGTFTLGSTMSSVAGTSTTAFNFDGGTLVAGAPVTIPNTIDAVNIKNGGAIFNTNGNSINVDANLIKFAGTSTGGLAKNGAGTLTLSGASTYTGATNVSAGTLRVNGSIASAVSVLAGKLDGTGDGLTTGLISAAVVIGDNSVGPKDAILAPGNSVGTLTSTNSLTFNSDAIFALEVDSSANMGMGAFDKMVANGVTIDPAATISLADIALTPTALPLGTFFTVIDNGPSSGSILQTFANLANLGTISDGTNTYQANYAGGLDGNDLVLTVVAIPEPSTIVLGGLALLGLAGMNLRRRRMAKQEA